MNPGSDLALSNLQAMRVAAKAFMLEIQPFDVRSPNQFDSAFNTMSNQHIAAVVIQEEPMLSANAKSLAGQAAKYRTPSIGFGTLADAGGLISYGASSTDLFRRSAMFVDKILKGAKPGDLPIEQAMIFELVINMKTARALGIKIPQSILLRADRLIE